MYILIASAMILVLALWCVRKLLLDDIAFLLHTLRYALDAGSLTIASQWKTRCVYLGMAAKHNATNSVLLRKTMLYADAQLGHVTKIVADDQNNTLNRWTRNTNGRLERK